MVIIFFRANTLHAFFCSILNIYSSSILFYIQYSEEEVELSFEEFYDDVHTEFLKFGELVNFKVHVCCCCLKKCFYLISLENDFSIEDCIIYVIDELAVSLEKMRLLGQSLVSD